MTTTVGFRVGLIIAFGVLKLFLLSGLLVSQASYASQNTVYYNIPAQSLNDALLKFAADSHLELVFSADMVRGSKSHPVTGAMTSEQALQSLLQDSDFSFRFVDSHTVTLSSIVKPSGETRDQSPPVLEAMTVVGNSEVNEHPNAADETVLLTEENRSYQVVNISSATRTDTPIRQVPQSIQVIDRSLLDDQQNLTISEALVNFSGVVPRHQLYTPVIEGTLIRGFRAEQLIDGFTQYYNAGDRESTVNIDKIEVLKGSNAVLYSGGSGAPVGGVVNLVSKLPKSKAFAEAGFKMGSYSFYEPYIDWNQPFSDAVLFRVTGEYTHSGSLVDVVETQRFNINPTLTFTDNNATTLTLQSKISRWQQPDYQGLPATGSLTGDFRTPVKTFIGPANIADSHSNSDSVWGTLEHKISSMWSLNLKAQYAYSEFDQKVQSLFGSDGFVADQPFIPNSTWALTNAELFQKQEVVSVLGNALAKFDLGPTENTLLLGADYSELTDKGFISADFGSFGLGVGSVDLSAPEFPVAYSNPTTPINDPVVKNITYGGYLQWQNSFYKRFHQLLSLRLGGMEIDYQDIVSSIAAKTQTLKLLPRIGGVFDITKDMSVFAAYSEGMRGQPFVNFSGPPQPELSRQIEAGIKFDFSGQLSGQMAVYQINRSHVAVTDPQDPGLGSIATGQQRSRGFEADVIWQPNEAIGLLANYAHTQAEFTDDLAGVPKGNNVAMVPENAGRLWVNYRFPQSALKGLSMGIGVYLRSSAYLSNDNGFKTGGYYSFDAAMAYETERFKLATTVKNLTDEEYFQPYGYFSGRVAPASGVAVFVSGVVKF